ncbi:MAG: hypothetical protein WCO18_02660 [bacterium]
MTGTPLEEVNGQSIVPERPFKRFISRQEILKRRIRHSIKEKAAKLKAGMTIDDIVEVLWPSYKKDDSKKTKKKKRSKH